MIVKGTPASGGERLVDHIERQDTNERVEVKELRGTAAEDFRGALLEMEAVGSGSRTKRPFYHASINSQADERLTDEQRMYAIDRLEKELGLTDQPRAVVVHEKNGREHCHVVWLRVNADTMTAIRADHNFRKHEIAARELEREFGHERVQGAHIERDGKARPERAPSHAEMQQAERTKIKPEMAREQLTALWRGATTGQEFAKALDEAGWKLARGDRRDFVAIDMKGGVHSLSRRIEGVTAKDVRARLADIDLARVPTVIQARAMQFERHGRPEPVRAPRRRAPSHTRKQPVRLIGGVVRPANRIGRPAAGVVKAAGKALDAVATAFESLLGGAPAKSKGRAKDDDRIPLDTGPVPAKAEIEEAHRRDQEERSSRRQRYLREFSREVPQEGERDAELERDRKGRERER